jgi:hypothetical protein
MRSHVFNPEKDVVCDVWVLTPRSSIDGHQHYEGTCRFHLQDRGLFADMCRLCRWMGKDKEERKNRKMKSVDTVKKESVVG